MKLPKTLQGKFIYYHDVPKTYAMYRNDPRYAHLLVQLQEDLENGKHDIEHEYSYFQNRVGSSTKTKTSSDLSQNILRLTQSKTLAKSGVTVNDDTKTYMVPDGYRFNKKTKNALLTLRSKGYERINNTN